MPETGIGLFPDVGGGWYLSRLPGRMGEFIALTGARLDGAECLALGIATHYLPAAALDGVKARILADPGSIPSILESFAVPEPEPKVVAHREAIDQLFAGQTVEAILAALEADGSFWALAQRTSLRAKSPQAMKVSLHLIRQGRHMDFD